LALSATAEAALASDGDAARAPPYAWPVLLFLAAVPCVLAVIQLGRLHPDELFQALEPALYRARGYGVLAWEWREGIRNWAVPLFFSWLIRLCDYFEIRDPQAIRAVVAVPLFALHFWMLLSVFRYAQRRVGQEGALWATLAVGLYAPVLAFAGRTLGESFSAALLVISLERLDRPAEQTRNGFAAGLWMGAAVVARYGSAVFAGALLLWLLATGRWRQLGVVTLGIALVALALGALDWATWGQPFHSFIAYLRFNVLSDQAVVHFGSAPPSYYLLPIAHAAPIWIWPAIAATLWMQRFRVPAWLFLAAVYLAVLCRTPHKEERFLYPALVLLVAGSAPEAVRVLQKLRQPILRVSLLCVMSMLSLGTYYFLDELWPARGDQFRAIVKATRPSEATGLVIVNEGLWGSGGFFYIGRPIPWVTCDWPSDSVFQLAMRDRRFNRAVTYDGRALAELEAAGFRRIDKLGAATILARPAR
jgi:GPI mannosyltransferase 3